MTLRVFVSGANRGIGFEFTKQYIARNDQVIAACRHPEKADRLQLLAKEKPNQLVLLPLDMSEEKLIEIASKTVKSTISGLDVLINNAGLGPNGPAEDISTVNTASLTEMFTVNAFGPLVLAKSLMDLLKAGKTPKIINISSEAGSIIKKQDGGWYGYGGSKAALNFFTRALAADLREKGIIVVAVHPGWVKTDMGGKNALLLPEDSIRQIISVIDQLKMDDTGKFFTHDGKEHFW